MKRIATLIIFLQTFSLLRAQYESVVFDYSLSYFNNGQPLPAEEKLIFSGSTSKDVQMVEVAVYKPNADKALYESAWRRNPGETSEMYKIPFNYPLQANSDYDIRIIHFNLMKDEQKRELIRNLQEELNLTVDELLIIKDGKVELNTSKSKFVRLLNKIAEDRLENYRFKNEWTFEGVSDLVKVYLDKMDQESEDFETDSTKSRVSELKKFYDNKRRSIKDLITYSVNPILEQQIYYISDLYLVQDYSTEKISGSLAINVGYGGAYLSGNDNGFNYDSAPYLGLSFPLSRRIYTHPVLNNTSFSFGVFLEDFEEDGTILTGPIFGRPYFAGLGYRLFRFIRINAGAVILEKDGNSSVDSNGVSVTGSQIQLRPFVGISAEINLNISLGGKK